MTLISVLRPRTLASVLGLASAFALLTGCGAHSITTGADPLNKGGVMSGKIYGGNQPVTGSTVQLWSVGTTGYGSQGTLLATTTTTAPDGGFGFTQTGAAGPTIPISSLYNCPTGTAQIYILATGGNTGSGTNSNFAAIAALGPCNQAGNLFVDLNEVTTAATMAAMQQFFDPNTDSFGSPSGTQAQLGLANAQTTIANLVDISTGTARQTYTVPNASGITGPVMTASASANGGVNGYLKLNTIANILAACVNSNGVGSMPDNCTTLFTNAIPQAVAYTSHNAQSSFTFPTASDTVQAAYYILSNPTQSQDIGTTGKLHNLFSLQSATAPFVGLTSQPLDWTLHLQYTSGSTTCSTNSNKAFYNTTTHFLAVDALGDVWVGGGSSSSDSVAELGPNGAPTGCYGGGVLPTTSTVAIDPNGSVYVGSAANSQIYVIPNSGTATSPSYGTPFTWTTPAVFGGIALDPSGNLFFTPTVKTAAPLQEYVLSSPTSAPVSTTSPRTVGGNVSSQTGGAYTYVASDSNGRIFSPNSVYASAGTFAELFPSTGTGNVNGYLLANVAPTKVPATNPYGVAVDSNNKVFSSTTCCAAATTNIIYSLAIAADNSTTTVVSSPRFLGGVTTPRGLSIDGAGNVWAVMADEVVLATTNPTVAAIYAVSEVSNDLTTGISPNSATGAQANPSTCGSSSTCATGGGFQDASFPTNATALAIDPSGNVWLPNGSGSTGISEIVGQAVPVTTPTAAGPGKLPN